MRRSAVCNAASAGRRPLMGEELGQNIQRQLPQPLALTHEPVLEHAPRKSQPSSNRPRTGRPPAPAPPGRPPPPAARRPRHRRRPRPRRGEGLASELKARGSAEASARRSTNRVSRSRPRACCGDRSPQSRAASLCREWGGPEAERNRRAGPRPSWSAGAGEGRPQSDLEVSEQRESEPAPMSGRACPLLSPILAPRCLPTSRQGAPNPPRCAES